jgi:uncharacterized protein (DUF1501 family)
VCCHEYQQLATRREFLARGTGLLGLGAAGLTMPAWLPQVALADSYAADRDVIVSIFLRGGADGLTLCVPFGDVNYYVARPTIAIPRPDALDQNRSIALDNFFAVPQPLAPLVPAFQAGQLALIHGVGLTYNTRSHFDAQYFMEVGKSDDPQLKSGWLARHLATSTPRRVNASLRAVSVSDGLAATLQGGPNTLPVADPRTFGIDGDVTTRAARQAWLAQEFAESEEPVRSFALDALATIELLRRVDVDGYRPANGAAYGTTSLGKGLRSVAALIKADLGIEAAHLDLGDWDTHTDQDPIAGTMARLMTELANALAAFWQDVIASAFAENVTVVVLSEFGRNVRENGGLGTDHGRGTVMFAMGRGIRGRRVVTHNWKALAVENLADRQDLPVTIDYRDVLAEIVRNRLGNNNLGVVFPGYVPTMRGITT